MKLIEMIDKAGRLNAEIKTREKNLTELKKQIALKAVKGDNHGKKYICKKVITKLFSELDPETVKNQFNWLMLDEIDFLDCCKIQLKEVRKFLPSNTVDDLRYTTGDKVALSFKKR